MVLPFPDQVLNDDVYPQVFSNYKTVSYGLHQNYKLKKNTRNKNCSVKTGTHCFHVYISKYQITLMICGKEVTTGQPSLIIAPWSLQWQYGPHTVYYGTSPAGCKVIHGDQTVFLQWSEGIPTLSGMGKAYPRLHISTGQARLYFPATQFPHL